MNKYIFNESGIQIIDIINKDSNSYLWKIDYNCVMSRNYCVEVGSSLNLQPDCYSEGCNAILQKHIDVYT